MIEVIKTVNCENSNTIFGFNSENVYYTVTVNNNGDYWLQLSGSYSFGNHGHEKILSHIKSIGIVLRENVTAKKYFSKA
ncbi:hypothetical protein [Acinetobacter phage P577]|nr:hypothetical protein [Acinetobacter phage P577]